jgi:hypothetical protein
VRRKVVGHEARISFNKTNVPLATAIPLNVGIKNFLTTVLAPEQKYLVRLSGNVRYTLRLLLFTNMELRELSIKR